MAPEIIKRKKKEDASLAEQVREAPSLRKEYKEPDRLLIPTGSTELNLICSGDPFGGFATGKLVNIIGDNSSGKTLLVLSMLAEMCQIPDFDDYELIFDDAEESLEFNIEEMFGSKLAGRLNTDIKSDSAEDFYGNFLRCFKEYKRFIYIVDSWDALRTIEEEERAEQFEKDPDKVKGTFGQAKQRLASEIFRNTCAELKGQESLLVVISQVRMNLNAGMFGKKTQRSGGKALGHYACHEVWMAVKEHLKKGVREYGTTALVQVTKNKLTGRRDFCEFPIFYTYGIDDTGACVDFLLKEKFWVIKKHKVKDGKKEKEVAYIQTDETMPDMPKLDREGLIKHIEENNLLKSLRLSVFDAWKIIDAELKVNRKKKYE